MIGVSGLASSAVNCIVGSGIFGLPGIAAAMLGPAAFLGYLVCVVLIGLVGLCFAEAGSRVAGGGGLYAYATESFGPIVGGVAGTLLWVANSVVSDAAVANLLVDTLALAVPAAGAGIVRVAILAALYAGLVVVNVRGARGGARLSLTLAIVKIAPLVLLVVAGVFFVHPANLSVMHLPGIPAIGQGAAVLFFAFMGVEGGLNVSGEVANPSRTVPRAIFLALSIVAALYIGLQTAAQGVLGTALAGSTAPLVTMATAMFGTWGARLLFATTLLSVAGFLSADVLCAPLVFAALAERRQLPRALAAVHPRYKPPAAAIVTDAFLCAIFACSGSFRQLVLLSTSGTLLLYLICCLGVLRLRARNVATAGPPFRAPGGPIVPIAASAIILWLLATLAWPELIAAAALVVVSGAAYTVQERARRLKSSTIGAW